MLNKIIELVNSNVSGANATLVSPPEDGAGDSSVLVESAKIFEVCKFLKENEELDFKALQAVSYTHLTLPTNREV